MKSEKLYMILCLLVGVYTLSGCIEEFEADIPTEDSDLLVVEGTICSGSLNKFILSHSLPVNSSYISPIIDGQPAYLNQTGTVTRATVSVRGKDGSEYNAQETAYGCYTCQIGSLNPDVAYYLHIETDGEVYESEPQKPLRTEKIADVSGVQNTPESDIDVLVTAEAPLDPDKSYFYSWTYDETWEVYPDYVTEVYFDIELKRPIPLINTRLFPDRGWKDGKSSTIMIGASTNYEGQQIQGLKMYELSRSDERMYHRYSGLLHQRAISKAEYEYEIARRQAGEEMGGLFTPQPSSLPTNIHCLTSNKRVIGFVGCSLNTSEYRFFFNPMNFSIHYSQQPDARVWLEDCNEEDCCEMVRRGFYLCEWEDSRLSGGKLRTAWATRYQLDVRSKGAYIEKPDFWSLTENVSY